MARIDFHLVGHARIFGIANLAERFLQVVLEDVAHSHQFHVFVAMQELLGRFRAPSAAADQPRLQLLIARASHQLRPDNRKYSGGRARPRGFHHKRPSGDFVRTLFHAWLLASVGFQCDCIVLR
jgi:hypothetical protein